MIATLETAKSLTGQNQPIMIIMKTEMGYGIDYMMGSHKWHGIAPNDEQLEIALNQQVESLEIISDIKILITIYASLFKISLLILLSFYDS